MARAIIRALPLYLDGKKIAEVSDGSYDIESGDEMQIGSEGVLGISDGTITANASFNCIIPVKGMQIAIDQIILNKKYVQLGVPVNGKFHQCDGRLSGVNYSWDHKNGRCNGAFKFMGAGPELTG